MTGTKRIRGAKLQAIREEHFSLHPLCVKCLELGFTIAATELDHIVPLFKNGEEKRSNRQGLCEEHHAEKTRADRSYKPKGVGVDGLPTDPRHFWNQPKRKS